MTPRLRAIRTWEDHRDATGHPGTHPTDARRSTCLAARPDLRFDLQGPLAEQLTRGKVAGCHLDPDLARAACRSGTEREAAFGQVGTAQRHIENEGVQDGDLFLFFGWFRAIEHRNGTWRYREHAPFVHRLFGWLQVREIVRTGVRSRSLLWKYPGPRAPPVWGRWDENNPVLLGDQCADDRRQDDTTPRGPARSRRTPRGS